MPPARPLARVFENATPEPNTGCLLWLGAINNNGYGVLSAEAITKERYAHRIAWIVARGPIPTGLCVLHHCDNGGLGCIEPRHLFLGTMADNTADMVRKGRAKGAEIRRICPRGHAKYVSPGGKLKCRECQRECCRRRRHKRRLAHARSPLAPSSR